MNGSAIASDRADATKERGGTVDEMSRITFTALDSFMDGYTLILEIELAIGLGIDISHQSREFRRS